MRRKILIILFLLLPISKLLSLNNSLTNSCFIENNGQWDNSVKYLSISDFGKSWITKSGIIFDIYNKIPSYDSVKGQLIKYELLNSSLNDSTTLDFKGYNKCNEKYSFYLGNDSSKWQYGVNSYRLLTIDSVYQGIDFELFILDTFKLQNNFILAPNSNSTSIKMKFLWSDSVKVSQDSSKFIIYNKVNSLTFKRVTAYQIINDTLVPVYFTFIKNTDSTISFHLGNYNQAYELKIESILSVDSIENYSEIVFNEMQNKFGKYYQCGYTNINYNFLLNPLPTNKYYTKKLYEDYDAFYAKFNEYQMVLNQFIIFGGDSVRTYNGSTKDLPYSLFVDENTNVYLTGKTFSIDFPRSSFAFQYNINGVADAFISKFDFNGQLKYSTLYGDSLSDCGFSIVADSVENAFVTGSKQNQTNSIYNCFILKVNPSGTTKLVDVSLFGNDFNQGTCIKQLDSNLIVSGYTKATLINYNSQSFNNPNKNTDAFIFKTKTNCDSIKSFTTIGGAGDENAFNNYQNYGEKINIFQNNFYRFTISDSNYIYLIGSTKSSTFNNHQIDTSLKKSEIFVVKLDSNFNIIADTTFGGLDQDVGIDIKVMDDSFICITGFTFSTHDSTNSNTFPITNDAVFSIRTSGFYPTAFCTILNNNLDEIVYSTFLSDSSASMCWGIQTGQENNIYLSGTNYLNSYSTQNNFKYYYMNRNGFLFSFIPYPIPLIVR